MEYQNHLSFEKKVEDAIEKRVQKALERGEISEKQKWLGAYYGPFINQQKETPIVVQWIDEEVGYGVFAKEKILPFSWIGEYTGVVRKKKREDSANVYCFEYVIGEEKSARYVIDAEKRGNFTRLINHSRSGNLETASILFEKKMHVILYTIREILPGDELSYDYGEDYWKKRKLPREAEGTMR